MNTRATRGFYAPSAKFHASSLLLAFSLLGFLSGCQGGKGSNAREEALRAQAIAELKQELRPTVLAELRSETQPDTSDSSDTDAPPIVDTEAPPLAPQAHMDVDSPSDPVPESPQVFVSGRKEFLEVGTRLNAGDGTLRVSELYIAGNLEDKLPADVRDTYERAPDILYCYSVLESSSEDTHVTHVWRRDGRLVSRVELTVGKSPKWRTWSKQRTSPISKGHWSCEVLGPDESPLGLVVARTQS